MSALLYQDIIRLPRLFRFLQRPLAQFISTLRAPKSTEAYASIGGGSPLRRITDDQVSLLNTLWKFKKRKEKSSHNFCLLKFVVLVRPPGVPGLITYILTRS